MTLEQFEKAFNNSIKDFDKFCLRFLAEQGQKIVNEAKKRTPVVTGDLRKSWNLKSVEKKGKDYIGTINNHMEYATEIEYGEFGKIARNMITVPLNKYNNKASERFNYALRKYMRDKGID